MKQNKFQRETYLFSDLENPEPYEFPASCKFQIILFYILKMSSQNKGSNSLKKKLDKLELSDEDKRHEGQNKEEMKETDDEEDVELRDEYVEENSQYIFSDDEDNDEEIETNLNESNMDEGNEDETSKDTIISPMKKRAAPSDD